MNNNSNKLDIEDIMKSIREDIKTKGYVKSMLSFDDVIIDPSDAKSNKFDKILFNEEIYSLNHGWNVQTWHPLASTGGINGKIKLFIKKVIQKINRPYITTIVSEQNTFNATVVRTLNLLSNYIDEKAIGNDNNKIDELNYIIKRDLKKELNECKNENESLKISIKSYKELCESYVTKQSETEELIKVLEKKIELLELKTDKLLMMKVRE